MDKDPNKISDEIKESKRYFSVSTRLPQIETLNFVIHCKRLGITPSERVRDLILSDLKSPQKQFLAGTNKIKYNKTNNSFSWLVQLDSGQESEVLSNIPTPFLENLKHEIEEAQKERNSWGHQHNQDSVDIPSELTGGKEK